MKVELGLSRWMSIVLREVKLRNTGQWRDGFLRLLECNNGSMICSQAV